MRAADNEAQRQQMLLSALFGEARPDDVAACLRASRGGPSIERGLAAYRGHAAALAERALVAAFPTLQQLLGDESFAALARACWHRQPPTAGDIGLWGGDLPVFVADAETLAGEPYLADVARLDWAVHRAERAADGAPTEGLQRLAAGDPAQLRLLLAPGTAVVDSVHPIVAIWQAHRSASADRFDSVRAAFAAGVGECALVCRAGWRATVHALPADEAAFTRAVLAGRSLADALDHAGPGFDFEHWLILALREDRLAAVRDTAS